MRSILMLGGSRQQVVAIEKAKALGFRTVLCDYLPDNPGRKVADVFYQESTTNPDRILEIARLEEVSGVLAYSSDPASLTAGLIAESLGLPSNPVSSIDILSNKHLFRNYLSRSDLPCPAAFGFSANFPLEDIVLAIEHFRYPLVVKPTDSSGSKGVTIINNLKELPEAIAYAKTFSRNGVLICEEFIHRSFPAVIGGDIFVLDGEIRFWGLMSCLRDESMGGLVPVGKRIPSGISSKQISAIKKVLQRLVSLLDIRFGELNVEIIIGENDIPYILELGSRAGGNMIPMQLSDASGIDLVAANVLCAMGEHPGNVSWDSMNCEGAFATYVLHSERDAIYEGLELSDLAKAACYRKVLYLNPGTPVLKFDGANKAIGILFFKFEDNRKMDEFFDRVNSHVSLKICEA